MKQKKAAVSTIVLENLSNMRGKRSSKALNGRLSRWSFRKLQNIIDYKAKLAGLNVKYVDAKDTSSLCPICRGKLSPNEYRLMICPKCGLEEDRDVIAVKNLLHKYRGMWGFIRSPRKPSHEKRREGMKVNTRPERELSLE